MVVTLVILIALVSIAALIATWMIGKKYEEQEQERLRENNAKFRDELERSWEYEKTALNRNIPNLTFIYIAFFAIVILAGIILYLT